MTSTHSSRDEDDIRALVGVLVQAIRDKSLDRAMSVFAPEVVSFDLGPALQHGGGEAFRSRWRELFHAYQGALDYEVRDLVVAVDGDLAFSHSLNRTGGMTPSGDRLERWVRWTACYRRSGHRWLVVHEHVSAPVDLRSGRAVLDAKP